MIKLTNINFLVIFTIFLAASSFGTRYAYACTCCDTYRVTNVAQSDVLNVRSGLATDFKVVAKLRHNEGCISTNGERRGNWVYINANESGNAGWVNINFLKFFDGTNG